MCATRQVLSELRHRARHKQNSMKYHIMQSIGKTSGVHTATSEPTNEMALMAGSSQIKSTGARDPWITFSVPASKHSQNPQVNAFSVKLNVKVLFVRLD